MTTSSPSAGFAMALGAIDSAEAGRRIDIVV